MSAENIIITIHNRIHSALKKVAEEGLNKLKQEVSILYPPASAPDEPPHLRTGELKDGLDVEVDDLDIIYSSNAPYSSFLEWGTSRMAPRPFLRPHQDYMKARFTYNLLTKLKGG